jgi:hypothetical protein
MSDETKTVVTERPEMATPKQLNSVTVISLSPLKIVLIRATRCYLQTFIGLLVASSSGVASALGVTLSAGDFIHHVLICASIAVAPAFISLCQNALELLTKLDATNPALRA